MTSKKELLDDLNYRWRKLFDKFTCLTEMGFSIRHTKWLTGDQRAALLEAAICALDESDSWWEEGEKAGLSASDWVVRCMKKHRENALLRATKGSK